MTTQAPETTADATPETEAETEAARLHSRAVYIWLCIVTTIGFACAQIALLGPGKGVVAGLLTFVLAAACYQQGWVWRHDLAHLKKTSDVVAVIALCLFLLFVLQGDLLTALVLVLLGVQCALALQLRTRTHAWGSTLVAFVAVLAGASVAHHSAYVLGIAAYALCACFCLTAIHIDAATAPQSGAPGALGISTATATATTTATGAPPIGAWAHIRTAALLAISATLIYLLMPRLPAANLGGAFTKGWGLYEDRRELAQRLLPESADTREHFRDPPPPATDAQSGNAGNQTGGGNGGGQNTSQNPSQPPTQRDTLMPDAQLQLDSSIYLYVQADRPHYLVERTATHFDGRSWHALQNAWRRIPRPGNRFVLHGRPVDADASQAAIAVAKDLPIHPVLPPSATALTFPSEHLGRDFYDGLLAPGTLQAGTHYQVWLHPTRHRGQWVDSLAPAPDERDTQLPAGLDPRIAALARRIAQPEGPEGSARDAWQQAIALRDHLLENYQYSLSTIARQNDIPLAEFLFEQPHGHCEYFATALAVMLRTQGIPARMATGFVAADYNPITGFYEVKGTNAHAWVHAWVDGHWLLLEATPAYPLDAQPQTLSTANTQLRDYLAQLQAEEQRLREQQQGPLSLRERLRAFGLALLQTLTQAVDILWRALQWLAPRLAILGIAAAALWLIALHLPPRWRHALQDRLGWWRMQSLARSRHADAPLHALRTWHALLERHGQPRPAGMPLPAFLAQLRQHGWPDTPGAPGHTNTLQTLADTLDAALYQTQKRTPEDLHPTLPLLRQLYLSHWQHVKEGG